MVIHASRNYFRGLIDFGFHYFVDGRDRDTFGGTFPFDEHRHFHHI
jgi:hypothetical protein